eukprot:905133-Pleurochrysis_carterae.AAC.3
MAGDIYACACRAVSRVEGVEIHERASCATAKLTTKDERDDSKIGSDRAGWVGASAGEGSGKGEVQALC